MPGHLPLLALKVDGALPEPTPCAQFFDGVFGSPEPMDAEATRVSANDRLRKLAGWCNVNADLTAVEPGQQPRLEDFNLGSPDAARVTMSGGLPISVPNANMANIMIFANWEICKKRYARYKELIADNLVELERLASLYGYRSDWIDDPNAAPEYPANQTPEWDQYDKARRRRRALIDVRNEAMRRIMGILKAAHSNQTTNYGVLRNEGFINVIKDDDDQDLVNELARKDREYQATQPSSESSVTDFAGMRRAERRAAQRAQAEARELARTGNPRNEIKQYNCGEQLRLMRVALLKLADKQGNNRLKDFIYADLVSFMADGEKSVSVYRNYVFMGPSGVGKTTWAKLMGEVYKVSGIYMYGDVSVTMANDYVGRYIGQSGPQTKAKLDTNLENIVLIDEAYQITDSAGGDSASYADEVIGTLVDYMDKNIGLLMIIVAGYEEKMKKSFLQANEGLDRRFPNKFVFPSYEAEEMVGILEEKLRLPPRPRPPSRTPAFAPTPGAPEQPQQTGFGDKWAQNTGERLTMLIDLGLFAQAEIARAEKQKMADIKAGRPQSTSWEPSPDWVTQVVVWHTELFGKQGGSMENIAAKVNVYMSLPEKKPNANGRTLYTYENDMTVILQSLLDYEKWKTQLSDIRSPLVQYLMSPVSTSLATNMFYDYDGEDL